MKLGIVLALAVIAASPAQAADKKKVATGASVVIPAQSRDVAKVVAMLEKGKWKKARKKLVDIVEKTPGDSAARKLIEQIDGDPKALLGASSFPYLVRPGDSYKSLAQRHLGDPMKFYLLARYNGVLEPGKIKVGSTLRIPGVTAAVIEPKPSPKPAASKPAKATVKAATSTTKPAASVARPATPKADSPALSGALRKQGLSALAKGNPRVAVNLLERAAAADPANKTVAADLARARRVRDALQ